MICSTCQEMFWSDSQVVDDMYKQSDAGGARCCSHHMQPRTVSMRLPFASATEKLGLSGLAC